MATETETDTTRSIPTRGMGEQLAKGLREVWATPKARWALMILIPIVVVSIFGPQLAPNDPYATNTQDKFMGPGEGGYLLGTDNLGRDLFSRVLLGGRTTLYLGVSAAGLALLGGVPIGLVAGTYGGRVDELLMRLSDVALSFPSLLLALLVVAVLGASLTNAIIAIAIVYAPRIARVVRGSALSVKEEEYVKAAEANGESTFNIMFREIFPNVLGPILVEGSVRIGFAILVGTSLSFLGLGAQPPTPDWGYMVARSRSYIYETPWWLIWPSITLGLTILAFNMLGDGLRDVVDPQTEGEE